MSEKNHEASNEQVYLSNKNYKKSSGDVQNDNKLYKEAEEIVAQAGVASTSYLQRKLRIGHAQASQLIKFLEERGVVSATSKEKPGEN